MILPKSKRKIRQALPRIKLYKEVIKMKTGTLQVKLSNGTIGTVTWKRPEPDIDVPAEELKRREHEAIKMYIGIVLPKVMAMYEAGDVEGAAARWRDSGFYSPPPWETE